MIHKSNPDLLKYDTYIFDLHGYLYSCRMGFPDVVIGRIKFTSHFSDIYL